MKIREWVNIFLILTFMSVYGMVLVVVDLSGGGRYIVALLGVILFTVVGIRTYRSSEREGLATYIREQTDRKSDVFEEARCVIAKETSESPFDMRESYMLQMLLGKADLQEMLDTLKGWKAENDFEWNEQTVYDTLDIEATAESDIEFKVRHQTYTKTFKIKGNLSKAVPTDKIKDMADVDLNQIYTVNGLKFLLANVQPDDVNKLATWSISIDERHKNVYTGIITARDFTGGAM